MTRRGLWRETFATAALMMWTSIGLYYLIAVAIPWATRSLGEPWSFAPFLS